MIQLAEAYPDREIVVTLSRQLGWSHFLAPPWIPLAVRSFNPRRIDRALASVEGASAFVGEYSPPGVGLARPAELVAERRDPLDQGVIVCVARLGPLRGLDVFEVGGV